MNNNEKFVLSTREEWKKESGLKIKGHIKQSHDDKPLISIVTVVYNGVAYLEETIRSVITQTYENIEYIIIDGGSTDGTLDIIQKYENSIDYWVSESDSGIYDAMNKGIDIATGEWINFMNAGDSFYSHDTVYDIFSIQSDSDVIYGSTKMLFDDYNSKVLVPKSSSHKYHHAFVHQSAFIRTSLIKTYRYDCYFKIAGDTDLFTKLYNAGCRFEQRDNIVSVFDCTGVSSKPSYRMLKEDLIIGQKYNTFYFFQFSIRVLWILIKYWIRTVLPQSIVNRIRAQL